MRLKKWEDLPVEFRVEEVRPYYEVLRKKKLTLFVNRLFDIVVSTLLLGIMSPIFLVLALAIKLDSPGPVFYRQIRITQYGREFRIFKFRSMRVDADKGVQVTVSGDSRITRVGKLIRKCRLDEIAQLIDVFRGTMTFVGTRPEVPRYVEQYTAEMRATLLLPAGITSLCSIYFKDEDRLLDAADDVEQVYVKEVLPRKMKWNLKGIQGYSFWSNIKIMFMTVFAVLGKEYRTDTEENDESK